MEIVKGESASINGTVYSYWSGVASTSTIADVTGGSVSCLIKRNYTDNDNQAVLTLTGSVVSGPAGTVTVAITAAATNALTDITSNQVDWYYEVLVKVGTTYYRTGVQFISILPHAIKTLP
jgi:large exoprotein involved in heme utilization and adhesion